MNSVQLSEYQLKYTVRTCPYIFKCIFKYFKLYQKKKSTLYKYIFDKILLLYISYLIFVLFIIYIYWKKIGNVFFFPANFKYILFFVIF